MEGQKRVGLHIQSAERKYCQELYIQTNILEKYGEVKKFPDEQIESICQ